MKTMGVIVVDVQGDFTTWKNGALAVEGTDAAFIEKLRKASATLKQLGHTVLATQDWHPADHISFYTNHPGRKPFDVVEVRNKKQVLWPPHCVQGTENAKLLIDETFFDAVVQKGKDRRYDSYSGFQDDGGARTEMDGLLKKRSIQDLIVYGIATDYCVKATAQTRFPSASLLTFQTVCVLKGIQGPSAPSARIRHNSSERCLLGIARNA
jgi:nicotinamidase/pyrazinamidase